MIHHRLDAHARRVSGANLRPLPGGYRWETTSEHSFDVNGTVLCDERASLDTTCSLPIPFGFNGMWRSEQSGLSYMRNRWYSPQLAQFMSHDPLEYIDSYNPYAFASLDPVNFWDPWGLESWVVTK